MSFDIVDLILFNVAVDHVLLLAWDIWAIGNFYRALRRGENGLSSGLFLYFLAAGVTQLWSLSMTGLTYLHLNDDYEAFIVLFRSWSANWQVVAAAYLTYQIQKSRHESRHVNDDKQVNC